MEVFGGVLGWVEVFGAVSGWVDVFGVFWAPIGGVDITQRYATRREMSKNVEFC